MEAILTQKYNQASQFLNLNRCADQWIDILHYKNWSTLKTLHLNQCQIKDNQIRVLSQMDWPNLQQLRLQINAITGKGLQVLLQNKWLKLATLKLSQNKLQYQDVKLVLVAKNDLRLIDFTMNNWTQQGSFFTLPPKDLHSSNLIELNLCFNYIGSRGIKQLTKYSLPNLQNLQIQSCFINDEGSKHLSKARWPNIKHIEMQQNYVMYNGLHALQMYNIQNMKFLNLGNLDQIGNCQNDIDLIGLMILVGALSTNTMVMPSSLNLQFLEDMETIIKRKFIVNMYRR